MELTSQRMGFTIDDIFSERDWEDGTKKKADRAFKSAGELDQ